MPSLPQFCACLKYPKAPESYNILSWKGPTRISESKSWHQHMLCQSGLGVSEMAYPAWLSCLLARLVLLQFSLPSSVRHFGFTNEVFQTEISL